MSRPACSLPIKAILILLCFSCVHLCRGADAPARAKPRKKDKPKIVPGAIHGKIYAIDDELDLAMITVGSKDGVKPLMRFIVLREDGLVGYLVVSTVQPHESGALIDKHRTVRRLKVGDRVIKQISRKAED